MKVIFMGTPDYAEKILSALISADDVDVAAVYTQPDKPVGRKKVMTAPVVKELALAHAIALYQPSKLRDEAVVEQLCKIECDYIVVAAYGQILPKRVLEHAPCINLHASILPQYRGASPIQQSLLNGDGRTGVTAMLMNEGLDTGDILKIVEIPIACDELADSLFARLTDVAAALTLDVIRNFSMLTPVAQNDAEATHCSKITKADGLIDFNDCAEALYNRYRAFTPWPGVYLESGLKLKSIKLAEIEGQYRPGEIIAIGKASITVGCASGALELFSLQPPSKKEVNAIDYLHGKRLALADTLA